MRIFFVSNHAQHLMIFRGQLLATLAKMGHDVFACTPDCTDEIAHDLKNIGVSHRAIKLDRTGLNPLGDIFYFFQLLALFYKTRPDLVFNYTVKPVIYGSLAAKLAGVARIYSLIPGLGYVFTGDSIKHFFLRKIVYRLYRAAFDNNRVIFFLNSDDKVLFRSLSIITDRHTAVLLNGEGICLDRFATVPAKCEIVTFLLIARLIKDKGISEFVEAATILKKKYPETVYRIVGPYDSNPNAIKPESVQKWQEEGVIEYLGENWDVRPLIADSSVYVLPSYREGLPRTVLEAMAMGRPVVTTDVPGCRETVRDGENGFLVPVKDARALACAMEKFILNPDLIPVMGKRSREITEEKFDVHKINMTIIMAMGFSEETAR